MVAPMQGSTLAPAVRVQDAQQYNCMPLREIDVNNQRETAIARGQRRNMDSRSPRKKRGADPPITHYIAYRNPKKWWDIILDDVCATCVISPSLYGLLSSYILDDRTPGIRLHKAEFHIDNHSRPVLHDIIPILCVYQIKVCQKNTFLSICSYIINQVRITVQ